MSEALLTGWAHWQQDDAHQDRPEAGNQATLQNPGPDLLTYIFRGACMHAMTSSATHLAVSPTGMRYVASLNCFALQQSTTSHSGAVVEPEQKGPIMQGVG